ncbi:MAG: hypothetical protein KGO49_07680 [Gammaproteobacteria bacterium]|nr:hypothetical protein [Gammaproteobacteria bacterium]
MNHIENTLRITRKQYRKFAEMTKSVGCALNLSTPARIGARSEIDKKCWGSYSPWALLVCKDVTNPDTQWHERALITLSSTINIAEFRAAERPELDKSHLMDDELYSYIVWHEIGHRMDNFDAFELMRMENIKARDQCHKYMWLVNEVLADRYAWMKLRPNEPMPLSERGRQMQKKIAEAIKYMDVHLPRNNSIVRPLQSGQYNDVPEYMLTTPARAAFLGSKVCRQLIERTAAIHRKYAERGSRPLY